LRRLLAISGKRMSGKDTLTQLVSAAARARGHELSAYAFAGESKRLFVAAEAARGRELDLERLSNDRAYKESLRPELTRFTVAALAADPLVFVRAVAARIAEDPRAPLVSDLRLRLELDWLRPRFALRVARLQRSDAARAASGWRFDADKDLHHTETELDDPSLWDKVVPNDGAVDELAAHAQRLADWLITPP
jgi:phosphomevalonate kinase